MRTQITRPVRFREANSGYLGAHPPEVYRNLCGLTFHEPLTNVEETAKLDFAAI